MDFESRLIGGSARRARALRLIRPRSARSPPLCWTKINIALFFLLLLLVQLWVPAQVFSPRLVGQLIYDFVSHASDTEVEWSSGAGILEFPGSDTDPRGFALWRSNVVLEDGNTQGSNCDMGEGVHCVLETHPEWVSNGWIMGDYPVRIRDPEEEGMVGWRLRLLVRVGFLSDATGTDGVTFAAYFAEGEPYQSLNPRVVGWGVHDILRIPAYPDGHLDTVGVDISYLAGMTGHFYLVVLAGVSSERDWAVWLDAYLTFDVPLTNECCDGMQSEGELGVDCGGICSPCNRCSLGTLPTRFDWRNYHVLPPIRDQGACGSCWAFSALGAVEGTYSIEHCATAPAIDLSEQNLLSDCGAGGTCMGGYPPLDFLRDTGVVDEACFPYQSQSCLYSEDQDGDGISVTHCCDNAAAARYGCTPCLSCSDRCANPCPCNTCAASSGARWRIRFWVRVGELGGSIEEGIKRALICHGPLIACGAGHCVVIVGYDDFKGKWTIRNSWSEGWTNPGYEPGYGGVSYSMTGQSWVTEVYAVTLVYVA